MDRKRAPPALHGPGPGKDKPYAVGYGKPPANTRFRKGVSGNPKGRPKRAKSSLPRLNEERLKSIVMVEAYRTIKVNDGERQLDVPMAQAVLRAIAMKAVKGDHRSQRLFSELVSETERANRAVHDEWVELAIEYKRSWAEEFERCRRLGLPEPDPVPHPDHIEMDRRTGEVIVDGPLSEKQRNAGRQLVQRYLDSLDEQRWFRLAHRRARSDKQRGLFADLIAIEERLQTKLMGAIQTNPWIQRELKAQMQANRIKKSEEEGNKRADWVSGATALPGSRGQ
jgi:hypothetical protein